MTDPDPAISPRKRPRQGRSAATYEAILEAAARILEQGGAAALTTNAAAELAGVSVGSLYQYFPAKEAITAELIRRMRAEMLSDVLAAAERTRAATLTETVEELVRASIRHHTRRPGLAAELEFAETALPMQAETVELKARIAACLAEVLARHGIAASEVVLRDLSALTKGMAEAASAAGEQDFDDVAARISRAVRGYLQA